jgi:glycosyltransferase involved in cell wall biosynthesis
MNFNPLVSIALLCYNHEKYISKAIESILEQTYKNIELIIVDNASIDNSKNIIKTKICNDNRAKLIELSENTFVSFGWNFAAKNCNGEYIASLSGDDYFEKDKIEKQINYMLKNELTNSFTWVNCVDDNEKIIYNHHLDKTFNKNLSSFELKKKLITEGNTLCATSFIFHKSIFEKYGYYDHRLLQSQDYDLWLRIIRHEDIYILSEKLTNYRVRDDGNNLSINMNERSRKRSAFECINFLKQITEFDLNTLSLVIEKDCTEENKFYNLFEYFIKTKKELYASAILFSMYNSLKENSKIPSEKYNYFFDAYSNFDLLHILDKEELEKIIYKKDLQIIELNNLVESLRNISFKELLKIIIKKIIFR